MAETALGGAKHLFVELEKLHGFLDEWTRSGDHLEPEVSNYLHGHFLNKPLRDWDVSRPKPYFGFEIPDCPGNYWYVWFDAPIGYMASTLQWCKRHGQSFDDWWRNPNAEIHHFIGKDIMYFHTLFWPGMLYSSGYQLPRKVHVHGFLTVGGQNVKSYTPVDLNLTFRIGDQQASGFFEKGMTLGLEVRNVFDTDPPYVNLAPSGNGSGGYDATASDPIGRLFAVSLRKSF